MPENYNGDSIDLTPLHYVVHQADIDSIRNFAAGYKQWTNIGDKNGRNPLHWAARIGYVVTETSTPGTLVVRRLFMRPQRTDTLK
ncbi:hypothetical protein BC937DRAFT_86710 [Endogone sp. FLAS-F59071]|nr:hypothetical protein BC937DRAFT_86710 [Endogone sp. FLAS-F59071]|eukprot:RUS19916.1 hypothetical protein BC937DRAFT_86710 [Endogone sp. FLAS-F59071]